MPPITDEHTDELRARRLSRKGRQAAPAVNGSTPAAAQTAGAARDLLRGLITDGTRPDGERSVATDPATESNSTASANPQSEEHAVPESAPQTPRAGEAIDDLIRRVKDSAAGAAADASSSLEQRRPKGTADFTRDAAMSRAAARRRAPEGEPRGTDVAPKRSKRRLVGAAMVLLAGFAVVLAALAGTGGPNVPRRVDASVVSSRLPAKPSGDFGAVLRATIAVIAPELRAVAGRAASPAPAAANRHGVKRRQIRHRAAHARLKHRAAVAERAAATTPPARPTASTQTQNPPAAPAPTSTTSQAPTTSQPSSTTSSRPAGPTGAGPLGGIGACVKGC